LTEITAVLRLEHHATAPIALLVGPGGIGKSSLALAAAYALAGAFPDGQLYADLRGNHGNAADPHAVVGRFLRALGVDGATLPDDRDERIAMYRSQLAGKRVLVVLDDAATERQARPLVPGTASCRALVTSRHQLGALVGAARWTIPVLTTIDAVELLARIVGQERVAAEPDAAGAIVGLCARLPLAVSVAAARLAVHPSWRLEDFRRRLAEERDRLDELTVGDLDVRASIGLSYRMLDPEPRRLLRRLGLIDAPDWPAWVACALVDSTSAAAEGGLDRLVDVHLVEPLGRDAIDQHRFRLHDLVAAFARERALAEDGDAERAGALSRVLTGWLALATVADEAIPHHLVRPPTTNRPDPPPDVKIVDWDGANAWFEVERRSLVCAVDQACRSAWPDLAGPLALRLSGFLALRSYDDDWD
ncbi:MAG: NB-ARC domain-containing protein, partial [Pseudonocardiaceae bacterium]